MRQPCINYSASLDDIVAEGYETPWRTIGRDLGASSIGPKDLSLALPLVCVYVQGKDPRKVVCSNLCSVITLRLDRCLVSAYGCAPTFE